MISRWFFFIFMALAVLVAVVLDVWLVWTNASYGRVKGIDALYGIGILIVYLLFQSIITYLKLDDRYDNWKSKK